MYVGVKGKGVDQPPPVDTDGKTTQMHKNSTQMLWLIPGDLFGNFERYNCSHLAVSLSPTALHQ